MVQRRRREIHRLLAEAEQRAKAGGIDDDVLDKMLAKLSRADRTKAQAAAVQWRDRAMVGLE